MNDHIVCITEAWGETYCVWVPDVDAACFESHIGHVRDVLRYHEPWDSGAERITRIVLEPMIWNDYDEQEVATA